MAKTIRHLQEFHDSMGLPCPPTFELPIQNATAHAVTDQVSMNLFRTADLLKTIGAANEDDVLLCRIRLIVEELGEVVEAILDNDPPEAILHEMTDLRYVVEGLVVTLGLGDVADEAFDRIHAANMSKLDDDGNPVRGPGGKITKGPNYKSADLSDLF